MNKEEREKLLCIVESYGDNMKRSARKNGYEGIFESNAKNALNEIKRILLSERS